jgi:tRNA(Arg) A34 adenosine deaminase TadA
MTETEDERHEQHIEQTHQLAREAGSRGDGPYGSILVVDGDVVMKETNRERTDNDIALHPELTLARRAARELTAEKCERAVMYTSTEPCPMCAGGIAITGLRGVVYSVSNQQKATEFDLSPGVPCDEVFDRLGVDIDVVGGVLEAEGLDVHRIYLSE